MPKPSTFSMMFYTPNSEDAVYLRFIVDLTRKQYHGISNLNKRRGYTLIRLIRSHGHLQQQSKDVGVGYIVFIGEVARFREITATLSQKIKSNSIYLRPLEDFDQ